VIAGPWLDRLDLARRVGPARWALLGGVMRVAALVAFAQAIYVMGYRPAIRSSSYTYAPTLLQETIRAANDGYPFAAYSRRDSTRIVRLDQYASGYYDPGLPALISITSLAGRAAFGLHFKVDERTIFRIVFGLSLAAALLLICPALPLPVSLGALASLAASILIRVDGQDAFSWARWWDAYSTILVAMLIAGLLTARRSRWRTLYFAGLTILAGCSRLLREEVVVTTYAALVGLVATLLALWLAARWWVRSPSAADAIWRPLRQCVLVSTLFCLGLAAAPYVLRAAIAAAWRIPFAETTTAVHGSGHSLYIGLGYVPNAYAISWRDNVAMSHSHLIDPTVRVEDPRYQDVLQGEAIRIMLESPWLVRANVIQKIVDTTSYLGTSAGLRTIAVLAALATIASLSVVVWWRGPLMLALFGGALGLAAGASAPALVIHPSYWFGIQAVVILLAFVAPPVVAAVVRAEAAQRLADVSGDTVLESRRVTERAMILLGLAALAVGVSTGGWCAIRAFRYARERAAIAASADPLADLRRDGYRYARYFNDLPRDAQERLTAAISATNDPRVAVPVPQTTVDGFRPALVVYTPRQLHVIAWLGKEQPVAAFPSGSAAAFVSYCVACEQVRRDLPNDAYMLDDAHVRLDVAGINNKSWTDRYQMLSIPIEAAMPPTGDIRLAFQQITTWDDITATFALKTDGNWQVHLR